VLPAATKRFRETIVFVHHFGGSQRTVLRHVKLANMLGFDAVRFNLVFNELNIGQPFPITSNLKFGASQVWTDQIESILNAIPGRKILYTFSMPSVGALGAIAHRKASDIAGWVCDGGPFLQVLRCSWNLLAHEYKIDNLILRGLYTGAVYLLFGTGTEITVPLWCAALPQKFPVLSIRGEKDPLVPVSAIEDVFAFAPQIELQRLSLPEGGHLDGLKKFPSLYEAPVRAFLTRIGTPTSL
jgi:pimeloyl-ACP methyl ester carboxylesterase